MSSKKDTTINDGLNIRAGTGKLSDLPETFEGADKLAGISSEDVVDNLIINEPADVDEVSTEELLTTRDKISDEIDRLKQEKIKIQNELNRRPVGAQDLAEKMRNKHRRNDQ